MARIDLPSGGWCEFRDRLMAQDRMAVQAAIRTTYRPDPDNPGSEMRQEDGGTVERMRVALAARLITAWSFPGVPVPSQNIADPDDLIGSTLDLDDYDALLDAMEPLFTRVVRGPKPAAKAGSPEPPRETAPAENPAP